MIDYPEKFSARWASHPDQFKLELRFGDGRWVRYSYSAAQKLIEIRDSSGLVEVIAAGESEGLAPQRLALRVVQ